MTCQSTRINLQRAETGRSLSRLGGQCSRAQLSGRGDSTLSLLDQLLIDAGHVEWRKVRLLDSWLPEQFHRALAGLFAVKDARRVCRIGEAYLLGYRLQVTLHLLSLTAVCTLTLDCFVRELGRLLVV